MYPVSMTKDLYKLVSRVKGGLGPAERQEFDRVLDLISENPFHPYVYRGPVQAARDKNVHHSEVGAMRLIWRLVDGKEVILAYLGEHDPALNWAMRHRIELDDGLVNIKDTIKLKAPARREQGLFATLWSRQGRDDIFQNCSDDELIAMGVSSELIPSLRNMKELSALQSLEGLVPPTIFDDLFAQAIETVELPPAPEESSIRESLERYGGGEELVRFVNSDEFKRALEGSMEDWMLFLAPRQRRLVYTNYNGPARVKGVAGSGKTVVAIHRARIMAQRNIQDSGRDRVLFLTYGSRLPKVTEWLLKHLTNDGPEMKVIEARSLYSWVGSLLWHQQDRLKEKFPPDGRLTVEHSASTLAGYLNAAIEEVEPDYPGLSLWEKDLDFFRDEIKYRIKGRNALALQAYLSLPGTGRGSPLRETARRAMFDVTLAYQRRLKDAGKYDWEDLILAALEHVEREAHKYRYVGAVVDEVQDLTEATMKLVRKMVVSGPDDLLLAGDGTQRIYKGGFSLGSVGIDVRGRGAILKYNYRNTREIMRLASAIMHGARIDDLDDDEIAELIEPEEVVRTGDVPVIRVFDAKGSHQTKSLGRPEFEELEDIGKEIRDLKMRQDLRDRDFAVLYRNRPPYLELAEELLSHKYGCRTVVLDRTDNGDASEVAEAYFGPGVKLSTIHSAKGLEFKVVFIVGASDGLLPYFHDGEDNLPPDEREQQLEAERRVLYVAVTRARDYLYITVPRGQECSRYLREIPEEVLCRLEG